ncbi:ATP-binding protein [Streptomyces sp. NBC_01296]|uniref:ATP-binding protein n=1 Tax=Streptomyces sp. NBC_01296 TaxID=2903816 RepID=UPI002E130F81|nr:ATP-binding protein [Streptomyces sp. NBC_01296]
MSETSYDASHIQVLEGLAAVRKRPGMFIGSVGERGLHRLVFELVGHAVAEALAGHGDTIDVTITPDGGVRVVDNGRGIPTDPGIEAVLTEFRAGTVHDVGICVVNALSSRLEVEVRRDGLRWTQEYGRGVPVAPPARREEAAETGTVITFWPDAGIFETTDFSFATLSYRFRELASLNRGLALSLTDERSTTRTVRHSCEQGAQDLVSHLNSRKGEPIHPTVIAFVAADEDSAISVEIALQWDTSDSGSVHSFANSIRTHEGGTHEAGFWTALPKAFNAYARQEHLLPGADDGLTRDAVGRGLTAVVSVKIDDPCFEGATRTRLDSTPTGTYVQEVVHEHLTAWLNRNPNEAAAIIRNATRTTAPNPR